LVKRARPNAIAVRNKFIGLRLYRMRSIKRENDIMKLETTRSFCVLVAWRIAIGRVAIITPDISCCLLLRPSSAAIRILRQIRTRKLIH
jgi:hypothetical protein